MTQLRKQDVQKRGNVYFADLKPGAGSIKGGKARTVPLHEHLIELGFIKFVDARAQGPLFYKPSTSAKPVDPLNPKRGPAVKTRERLGEWVREIGVDDPELKLKKGFVKKHRERGWTIDSKKYSVRMVRDKTLACHPLLEQWGTQTAPNMPWSFGHLMFRESRVIISTMLRLAREHNVPAAPIHDSLLVPRSKEEIAERVLDEQFTQIIGVKPTLKVRPLPARYF